MNLGYASHKILYQLLHYSHVRCLQSGEINTYITTPVRKLGGADCKANSSQAEAKKQMPELHSQFGKLCTFYVDKNKICRYWHKSLYEKLKKLTS
jgi:hypothetical protein